MPPARPIRTADPTKFTDEERAAGYRLLESLVVQQREEDRQRDEAILKLASEMGAPWKDAVIAAQALQREHAHKRAAIDAMLRARHDEREEKKSSQKQARAP